MREILFRGKRVGNGEMVVGDSLLRFEDGGTFIVHGGRARVKGMELKALTESVFMEVVPESVGQYTGIDDKNGRKIFEGDIIREDDVCQSGEIQLPSTTFEVQLRKGVWAAVGARWWDFLHNVAKRSEVIGNVCEGPDTKEGGLADA